MNLTGSQLYSKAVQGLRSPRSANILDQQFRLIFLYPMLFDRTLHGNYSNTLRNFLSVSMLKEIFVNNALNIVAIASKDHPLIDERGKKLDVREMVKGSIVSSGGGYSGGGAYGGYGAAAGETTVSTPRFPVDPHQFQQKINEKTATIRKYLDSDPRTKKLNPYVEIITLDNMIDVPVIVGTKDYQVDTLSLAFVLATALALKKPLNSWANAQFVFNVIENTKTEDAWKLITSLVDKKKSSMTERLIDYLTPTHPRIAGGLQKLKDSLTEPMQRFGSARRSVGQFGQTYVKPWVPSTGKSNREMDPGVLRHQDIDTEKTIPGQKYVGKEGDVYEPKGPFIPQSEFDIMQVVKGNLDDTRLFFKFMLHDDLLRSQFGLDRSPGQMTTAFEKVSPHAQAMLQRSHYDFMDYMRTNVSVAMTAAFWTVHPWNTNVDYTNVKDQFIDQQLNDSIAEVIGELGGALENTIKSGSADKMVEVTKGFNKLCDNNLERTYKRIGELGSIMDRGMSGIRSHAFTADQFQDFYETLDKVTEKYSGLGSDLQKQMSKLIDNADHVFNKAIHGVANAIDSMLNVYNSNYIPIDNNPFSNIAVYSNKMEAIGSEATEGMRPIVEPENISQYIKGLRDSLVRIILAHLYATFLSAVCSFMEYIEVEVETVSNDALDLPNYTLVIPVETVAMLHAAVISKSWRDLVQGGQSQNTNLTDNYIKGIVNFINKRLDVPNLIVIDSKKGHVYYKLQYMSQVNKTNVRTFETYVKSMTQTELQGNAY